MFVPIANACDKVRMLVVEQYSSQGDALKFYHGYNDHVLDPHRGNDVVHNGMLHKFYHGINDCITSIHAMDWYCSLGYASKVLTWSI